MVVTDTHALIWYLTADKKLGSDAKKVLVEAEAGKTRLIVPAVVMIETMVIVEKKKVDFSWQEFVESVVQFPSHIIYPIDDQVVFATQKVSSNLELHDRLISAIAQMHNCPLLTLDPEIIAYGEVDVIW